MDDLALARALARGDEDAFHILVDREGPSVLRLCFRILGRVDDAEDVAQEAFVLAYRALPTYRGDGPPGAWLARIATRESWRRSSQLARRRSTTTPLDVVTEATIADGTDVAAQAIAAEEAEAVRRAAAGLPEPYREVVALRFFADLSLADIAATTGRPEATIKTQLRRGLERLRSVIREGEA